MVDRSRWGSSFIRCIRRSALPSSLAICLARVMLMDIKAVSDEEKNPDSSSKTASKKTCYSMVNTFLNE
jgi:hypothetical protein